MLALLAFSTLACDYLSELGDGDEEKPSAKVPETQVACRFRVRAFSCEFPNGSEPTPDCLTVKTNEACTEATKGMTQIVDGCEFRLEYQNVEPKPGECAMVASEQKPETRPTGETCSAHEDCTSGLCQPNFYCTVGCKTDTDCANEFSNGCCVGQGALGYCLRQKECTTVCPDGAKPSGLPTICTCGAGFHLATDGSQCVKDV